MRTRRLAVVIIGTGAVVGWCLLLSGARGGLPPAAAQVSVPQTTEAPPDTQPPVTRTSPPTTVTPATQATTPTTARTGTTRPRGSTTTSTTQPAITTTMFLLPGVVGPVSSTAPPTTSPTNTPTGKLPRWTAVLFWVGVLGVITITAGQFIRTRPAARRAPGRVS